MDFRYAGDLTALEQGEAIDNMDMGGTIGGDASSGRRVRARA